MIAVYVGADTWTNFTSLPQLFHMQALGMIVTQL